MKIGSLVAVSWIDTVSADREHSRTEALALEPLTFTSYGRLLAQTKTKTVIASTQGLDDEQRIYRDVIVFPSEVVRKIKEVK